MSAQAQMRALLDQLMGTARDGSVYLCQPTSICKGVAEKPHVHRAGPDLYSLDPFDPRIVAQL